METEICVHYVKAVKSSLTPFYLFLGAKAPLELVRLTE